MVIIKSKVKRERKLLLQMFIYASLTEVEADVAGARRRSPTSKVPSTYNYFLRKFSC